MAHPKERYLLFFVASLSEGSKKSKRSLDIKDTLEEISEKLTKKHVFKWTEQRKNNNGNPRYTVSLKDIRICDDKAFILLNACDHEEEGILINRDTLASRPIPKRKNEDTGHEVLLGIKLDAGSGGHICVLEQAPILSKTRVSAALKTFCQEINDKLSFALFPLTNMKLLEEAAKGKLTAIELSNTEIEIDGLSDEANFRPKKHILQLAPPINGTLTTAFSKLLGLNYVKEEQYTNLKITYQDENKKSHSKTFEFSGKDLLTEAVQRKEMVYFSSNLNTTPKNIDDLQPLVKEMSEKLDEN